RASKIPILAPSQVFQTFLRYSYTGEVCPHSRELLRRIGRAPDLTPARRTDQRDHLQVYDRRGHEGIEVDAAKLADHAGAAGGAGGVRERERFGTAPRAEARV